MGMYTQYTQKLESFQSGNGGDPFAILAETHGLVAGFKAIATWDGEKYAEILKQACGGHGYMQISGLSRIHNDFGFGFVMTEGDNTVMAQ